MPNGQTVFLPPIRYQTSLFQEENRYQSLIFYPGSKRRAIASILPHIPSDEKVYCSPCSMEEFCKEGFKNLRAYYWTLQCPISKAAYFFVLNRISTLGMTFRANNSNIDKMRELNSFALQRLRDFKIKNFEVDLADYG